VIHWYFSLRGVLWQLEKHPTMIKPRVRHAGMNLAAFWLMSSSFQESIFKPSKRIFFFPNIIFSPAKSQIRRDDLRFPVDLRQRFFYS
jgi:hypothetical protein